MAERAEKKQLIQGYGYGLTPNGSSVHIIPLGIEHAPGGPYSFCDRQVEYDGAIEHEGNICLVCAKRYREVVASDPS